jgi:hypothetical protein
MENLFIKPNDDTPEVNFSTSGALSLSGRALPEDAASFFLPLIDWLSAYEAAHLSIPITFEMKLEYFNTASSKMLLDIFNKLESISQKGGSAKVNWYYPDGDDDMQEAGEEYAELVDIKFEMISC